MGVVKKKKRNKPRRGLCSQCNAQPPPQWWLQGRRTYSCKFWLTGLSDLKLAVRMQLISTNIPGRASPAHLSSCQEPKAIHPDSISLYAHGSLFNEEGQLEFTKKSHDLSSSHPEIVRKSLVQIMCSQGSWALPRSWDLRPQWKPQVQQRGSGLAFHNPVPRWLFRQRKITAKCKKKAWKILAKQLSSIRAARGWVRQGTRRRQDWHLLLRWRRRWQS